ncbi:LOW QUALITY PROTEIN: hypothetical protein U9M48_025676 [Paspalum notatum var. saurae]|uniref:Uncharacterized protein n=1 Tax=Paspalum notatum var. saurae TaxID=547442 RepID=A0AAQ3TQA6_PASNO
MELGILPLNLFSPRSRMTRLVSLAICGPSSVPCNPLLEKERYSNEVALKSSRGRVPLRLLWSALRILSIEQLPSPGGMLPLILLLCIPFHVVDVNCPENKLLEMLSTCRGHWAEVSTELVEADVEDDHAAGGHQFQWQATIQRIVGQVKMLQAGEVAKRWCDAPFETSRWQRDLNDCLVPVTPSHWQQSVPSSCHDLARLESCESPARNCRRDVFSCSEQELAGMANGISSRRAMARTGTGNLLLYLKYEKWSDCMASY